MAEKSLFGLQYLQVYELLSSKIPSYEVSAEVQAYRLLQINPTAQNVLEVGSGTLNSGIVFLETATCIQHLYGIEPSHFIHAALAKLTGDSIEGIDDKETQLYIQRMIRRLSPNKEKVKLIQGAGEHIPLQPSSIDAIFMNQVFHWLQKEQAIKEFHRVLSPDGIVLLDESGFHFDFGDTKGGVQLNNRHVIAHPYLTLSERITRELLLELNISIQKQNFSYMFDVESLTALFEHNGFERIDTPSGKPYETTILPYSSDTIRQIALHGARMRIAQTAPAVLQTPGLAEHIIETAMQRTETLWRETQDVATHILFAELLASFAFRKI